MARRKRRKDRQLLFVVLVLALVLFLVIGGLALARSSWRQESAQLPATEPKTTAAKNYYDPQAYYREDGFLRYEGAHLVGIDVSTHQKLIDWEQVAAAGVDFAIVRIGYRGSSRGELYEDETFRENLRGAKEAGLLVGGYFFSQAITVQEAWDEAVYVCELLDGTALDLPVFYDWEQVSEDSRTGDIREIPMTQCAQAFCERIEQDGYEAGVYFNQTYGNHYLDLEHLQDYTLWLAEYNEIPSYRYHFDLVQYTDSGSIPGIETDVDLDLWILEQ